MAVSFVRSSTMMTICASLLLLCVTIPAHAQFTSPLATGMRLDPAGQSIDLGSMPLGMALAPGGGKAAVVLSGWREQGLQTGHWRTSSARRPISPRTPRSRRKRVSMR
jgi:hypothetical protein